MTLPESFKSSYKSYIDAEWWRLDVPAELGGTVVPPSLRWAAAELVLGANPAVHMYSAGYAFSRVLYELGTEAQRELAAQMVENHWGATMVLTEPDAGSDVGAGRTKAVDNGDGTWSISGVKRFITSGEHDMSDNIVHFVLARPEGAKGGTKGLSLFIVPKFHVREDGSLGDRNGVYVTNVEHKMGLKVSTTCEVRFGEQEPAIGTLLGGEHDGIAQMFRIIENARMMVGTKAIATLSAGYLQARDYALERVQGADLTQNANKEAPRVTIIHHPDVRRSLMLQKAYAEGMRALVLYTATQQDVVDQHQREHGLTPPEPGSPAAIAEKVNDLLLPIVKGLGSERAWVLLGTESLQTFGGSGFLQDFPVEQYVRDAKIDTLYEGTTAIQGLDFFFRKIVRDKGEALSWLAGKIQETAAPATATTRSPLSASSWPRRWRPCRASSPTSAARPSSPTRVRAATRATSTSWARTPRGCCWPPATWSSGGCCCSRPRSRSGPSLPVRPPRTRTSTPARSPPRRSTPRTSCRACARSWPSPSSPTTR
ncbi:hypothetical protein GCM10025862_31760 [Arsenicicoccus piscis]|uniref:Acyl-CoA dehydrogenase n=1 Tax=Arsenicicoccus piscis TaxID=673954 RepID=A0ABQ6HSF0_9MICO|nr:hypothetical protein GCM10025862_31760 [Arsenicicoccus piscis]